MASISQVTPTLYLSGIEALNPSALACRHINLVVCSCDVSPRVKCSDVEWVGVPVQDEPHAPLHLHFDAVAERIHQNQSGGSLVCCIAGRSRSPALVMAYLMRFKSVSLFQAYCQVLAVRPSIRPNAGFWRQLLDYEKKLHHSNSVRMVSTSQGVLPEAIEPTKECYKLNV